MRMYDIIMKKRDGGTLSREEFHFFISGYVKGEIPDYQVSALLMAVYFRGLSAQETTDLTVEMALSGDTVDLSVFGDKTVDKHSTGGVGDKTTLIAAPIAAACGAVVAKMSGRGLGHTGGTVDKLESIPGFTVEMSRDAFFDAVRQTGIAVVGQSGNLAPADKKIYALRDVTATVDNLSLIASSIMSKKLAAGNRNIVLDVKVGSGAFMKTPEEARSLAKTMVGIGREAGRSTAAVITNMNIPLGMCIGNSLEVEEAIAVLEGNGPEDLVQVSLALAAQMVALSLGITMEEAAEMTRECLDSGNALEKFRQMVSAQGGRLEALGKAAHSYEVKSPADGFISSMNAEKIGICACNLGAGRKTKEDVIDDTAGIRMLKKTGDEILKGETLAVLYSDKDISFTPESDAYLAALTFSDRKPVAEPLIYETII